MTTEAEHLRRLADLAEDIGDVGEKHDDEALATSGPFIALRLRRIADRLDAEAERRDDR